LNSEAVTAWSALPDWPTAETKAIWTEFVQGLTPGDNRTWTDRRYWASVTWHGIPLPTGAAVRLYLWNGQATVLSADGLPHGVLNAPLNPNRRGLLRATVSEGAGRLDLSYLGPDDLWVA